MHSVVVHERNFVDSRTNYRGENENECKRKLKRQNSTSNDSFQTYLQEFILIVYFSKIYTTSLKSWPNKSSVFTKRLFSKFCSLVNIVSLLSTYLLEGLPLLEFAAISANRVWGSLIVHMVFGHRQPKSKAYQRFFPRTSKY